MKTPGLRRPGRRFVLLAVLPIAALLGATVAVLFAVIVWTALEQDRYALEASRRLADAAFAVTRGAMARTIVDYAVWDDALRHLALALDEDWAAENLVGLQRATGAEVSFVVDAAGRTLFGLEDGRRIDRPVEAELGSGLGSLLAAARARAGEAATGFVIDANGTPVLAAAAAVLPHTDRVERPAGPPPVILAADRLDEARLREIADSYLLHGLRLADPAEDAGGAGLLPLATADGDRLGSLLWRPDRPGTELLWRVMPALAALALGLGLAATLGLVRHARHAAVAIRASEERAATDALTGLPNRVLLRDRIGQELARIRRTPGRVALLYLDLDGFKQVNDAHGHAAGDALLRLVADRLRGCVRESDTLARIGGDEFVILLPEPASAEAAAACAKRASAALAQPFHLAEAGAATVAIGVSIGIAVTSADTPDAAVDALLRAADRALYRAKREGRGTWRLAEDADFAVGAVPT